uniref:eIF-4F 25 kDa subunit n=2 Tax=Caenorhabditis tropicalis TaxID=1561998 RepID=A0A1I7U3T8_9PELO
MSDSNLALEQLSIKEDNKGMTELEQPVEAAPENQTLYPLKRDWTWWYLNDERSKSWEERLKKVYTFKSVPEFWALYDSIRPPSGLNPQCDYNVFRDGIQPMWEVPENSNGGRWLIVIDRTKPDIVDAIWLEILMAMVGEQFGKDMESICGLVCNVRAKGSKISVWTKDCADDDTNMRIGVVIKEKLMAASKDLPKPLFDVIRYEDHDSCQKKTSSVVKAKLSLHSAEPLEKTSS